MNSRGSNYMLIDLEDLRALTSLSADRKQSTNLMKTEEGERRSQPIRHDFYRLRRRC